jgi:oxygen-dependent protoporphyrinogen oxidase
VYTDTGDLHRGDELYVATSGPQTARFLATMAPGLAPKLTAMRYASLVVVHCSVPRSARLPKKGFGVLFKGNDRLKLLGVMCNSVLFPDRAPADKHLLTVCLGGLEGGAICDLDDEVLRREVAGLLHRLFNLPSVDVLLLSRWRNVIPQYEVGHHGVVALMRDAEKEFPGLRFVGVDDGGVGVPDRIARGLAVSAQAPRPSGRQESVERPWVSPTLEGG